MPLPTFRNATVSDRVSAPADQSVPPAVHVRVLTALGEREIAALAEVLVDCVEGGASVSFMAPLTHAKADAFWRKAAPAVTRHERQILVAEDETGAIVGTVTVIFDLPENQPHRADVAKMLVHRSARRRGIAGALLAAAERHAAAAGKTLLVLDTVTGGDAERLYERHGWERCGVIPNYALFPDGRPCSTTVFYKELRKPRQGADPF